MLQKPKGTRDFLPEQARVTRLIEEACIHTAKRFGFEEIRFPMFEKTELFERGVGETTDVVKKEMFRVISAANLEKYKEGSYDLKKEGLTLRPEGTASVVRSFIENKLYALRQPTKLFYLGSNFRNERPQAGRFREFTQFGVEVFGSTDPFTDAEVISLAYSILKENGLDDVVLSINSIGCPKCRPVFNEALKSFLADKVEKLCHDCQERYEKNPLRVIDCKIPEDQEMIKGHPVMLDYLCDECKEHFEGVKHALDLLDVKYVVDPSIVRGLDYYQKTAFEFKYKPLGAQDTVCGGGRYDGLVEQLGGPVMPGIGFGMGMDRLVLAREAKGNLPTFDERSGIYVLNLSDNERDDAIELVKKLRNEKLRVELEVTSKSMKAALKHADKSLFRYLVLIGEEEKKQGKYMLKDLEHSSQELVSFEELLEKVGK
ncbi:histidine--tRNA ligase [Guggenheimella bovis]